MYNIAINININKKKKKKNQYKQKQSSDLKVRHDFLSLRVVDLWNSLPESVVSAPSLNSFKNHLDKFWKEYKFSEDPPQIRESLYSTKDVTSDIEDQSTG